MHTFTIDGVTYLPFDNRLFEVQETIECIEDLEESQFYLHEDSVGMFELKSKSYESFDAIFIPREHPDIKTYYTIGDTGNLGDDFKSARVLNQLTPDQIEDCPNCDGWAGKTDDPETPKCYSCGYGTEKGIREAE